MTGRAVDLASWPRAEAFQLFRKYDRPHYAITVRIDVTRLMTERKAAGVSPYRAALYAIGAGVDAVPELRMRFRGERVTLYDRVEMSMSVPRPDGSFGYGYLPFQPGFAAFDQLAQDRIAVARDATDMGANAGERDDLVYLSCLPWLDYTSLNNALPGPEDCIPRISWGKMVAEGDTWSMPMTIEVHHALVDGAHVGAFFDTVAETFTTL
ncbi:chloramphenicol acetyltransferase [Ponticoccus sp. SC2-23]|uniref:chloramphenicol acetyltransferase n=1 Tax=Alexandriicola marinus TaxID=2081710 RepID=UPI000FDB7917|nr:chloramphenicol acetyltransferase [Alexandriicola marinus]MBM1222232.1 chloramphenicol acetyltransferase [Ponticoccus sp. SC6-9]MBM1226919.1 chloramphenicol acetyltransferase [Ponticoccus sp. SC6-15]MBM1231179.1 chloramphenicol acetyltransferase [Ponticoccus sp. SC6-38]MBM1235569.1 chloramphenicol acetyltransferase [Ponticoccus sp. SC6-45]MBM1240201.1 chloramphenicol acetyltransferase [Ponticoccus sp. SC6-49]MBM1244555.1 chloramphenicol acetyltransferase [Ponticoccus sp. SC2-64]MBM1249043